MEIIGHRGAAGLAPENSIEAIRKAMQTSVDMIELDVRLQNGVPVLSHDPIKTGQIYCPLKQALQEVNSKYALNLEIKELKAVNKTLRMLETYPGKIVFSSFKFNILKKIHDKLPEVEIAILEKWSGTRAVAEAALLGSKRLHMGERWLWKNFISAASKQGFDVYAYTVNDTDRADELKEWGVKGIVTDYPDVFASR